MQIKLLVPVLAFFILTGCKNNSRPEHQSQIQKASTFSTSGRVAINPDSSLALITPASGIKFWATGDTVEITSKAVGNNYNYLSISLDDRYSHRVLVSNDSTVTIKLPLNKNDSTQVGIFKATEASIGDVLINSVKSKSLSPIKSKKDLTIEFIGNSITCGMGADLTEIDCGEGEWFDQHNAYLAYGPRVARSLNANYILNSVSGMGMYRNWNDEGNEPVMPDVYKTLRLDGNTNALWQPSAHEPDLVSICLGTNDLSEGDGEKARKPFDVEKFTTAYIGFVDMIFSRYPNTKLALLTSPMISGEKGEQLLQSLKTVKENFDQNHKIAIYQFDLMQPGGCTTHPDLDDHKQMAQALLPFYKNLINQN